MSFEINSASSFVSSSSNSQNVSDRPLNPTEVNTTQCMSTSIASLTSVSSSSSSHPVRTSGVIDLTSGSLDDDMMGYLNKDLNEELSTYPNDAAATNTELDLDDYMMGPLMGPLNEELSTYPNDAAATNTELDIEKRLRSLAKNTGSLGFKNPVEIDEDSHNHVQSASSHKTDDDTELEPDDIDSEQDITGDLSVTSLKDNPKLNAKVLALVNAYTKADKDHKSKKIEKPLADLVKEMNKQGISIRQLIEMADNSNFKDLSLEQKYSLDKLCASIAEARASVLRKSKGNQKILQATAALTKALKNGDKDAENNAMDELATALRKKKVSPDELKNLMERMDVDENDTEKIPLDLITDDHLKKLDEKIVTQKQEIQTEKSRKFNNRVNLMFKIAAAVAVVALAVFGAVLVVAGIAACCHPLSMPLGIALIGAGVVSFLGATSIGGVALIAKSERGAKPKTDEGGKYAPIAKESPKATRPEDEDDEIDEIDLFPQGASSSSSSAASTLGFF